MKYLLQQMEAPRLEQKQLFQFFLCQPGSDIRYHIGIYRFHMQPVVVQENPEEFRSKHRSGSLIR